jgi:hypothetical protein
VKKRLVPDYRGHNQSEGFEFTQCPLALGERVRAASVWSTVRAQGFFYAALQRDLQWFAAHAE